MLRAAVRVPLLGVMFFFEHRCMTGTGTGTGTNTDTNTSTDTGTGTVENGPRSGAATPPGTRHHTNDTRSSMLLPSNTSQKLLAVCLLGIIGAQSYLWSVENRLLKIQNRKLQEEKQTTAAAAAVAVTTSVIACLEIFARAYRH